MKLVYNTATTGKFAKLRSNMEYLGICANERTDPVPDPEKYISHSHSSYELFLPVAGACRLEVGGRSYTVSEGAILVIPPEITHRLLAQRDEPLDYFFVQFTPEILPEDEELRAVVDALFDGDDGCLVRILPTKSRNYVYAAMDLLCSAGGENVHGYFFRTLYPCLAEIKERGEPVGSDSLPRPKEPEHKNGLISEVIEYISLHYAEVRDLSFINTEFHYSTVYVNALFKARLGVSPWRYILHIRLDRACDLLIRGERAESVAALCGFGDYSTFYRVFKKSYGITPSECRRNGKKPSLVR